MHMVADHQALELTERFAHADGVINQTLSVLMLEAHLDVMVKFSLIAERAEARFLSATS